MGNMKSSLKATSSTSTTVAPNNKIAAQSMTSRNIDKQLKADQKRMKKEVKLLLLGKISIPRQTD